MLKTVRESGWDRRFGVLSDIHKETPPQTVTTALSIMQESLRCHDIRHCGDCFDALNKILAQVEAVPDLEQDYLALWADFMQHQKKTRGCRKCSPPHWEIVRVGQSG